MFVIHIPLKSAKEEEKKKNRNIVARRSTKSAELCGSGSFGAERVWREAKVWEGAASGPPPRPTTGGPITSKKDVFAYGSLTTKFQKVKNPPLV